MDCECDIIDVGESEERVKETERRKREKERERVNFDTYERVTHGYKE